MSAYLEKQKLLDWLDKEYDDLFVGDIIEEIEKGVFDWQPND